MIRNALFSLVPIKKGATLENSINAVDIITGKRSAMPAMILRKNDGR